MFSVKSRVVQRSTNMLSRLLKKEYDDESVRLHVDKFSCLETKSPMGIGNAREGPASDNGHVVLALKVVFCEF